LTEATHTDQSPTAKQPPRPQSRVRAGKRALPTAHSQSIWARLFRDVQGALVQPVGGEENVSETQRLAIRRVASFEAELIFLEDSFALARTDGRVPEPADLNLYATMANAQRRFCEALGWQRTPRDLTMPLATYIQQPTKGESHG
jgi:hypothetical protein